MPGKKKVEKEVSGPLMRCKMKVGGVTVHPNTSDMEGTKAGTVSKNEATVTMSAVWEGSPENQNKSENAIFGRYTPSAYFSATIRNDAVIDKLLLLVNKEVYLDFTEVS